MKTSCAEIPAAAAASTNSSINDQRNGKGRSGTRSTFLFCWKASSSLIPQQSQRLLRLELDYNREENPLSQREVLKLASPSQRPWKNNFLFYNQFLINFNVLFLTNFARIPLKLFINSVNSSFIFSTSIQLNLRNRNFKRPQKSKTKIEISFLVSCLDLDKLTQNQQPTNKIIPNKLCEIQSTSRVKQNGAN